MQRVRRSTAVAALPAAPSGGTPGYFANPNPGGGVAATVPGYEWFNSVQEELASVIEFSGITLDGTKFNQLYQAIRRIFSKGVTLVDTGSANVYTAANSPAFVLADITPGLTQQVKIKTSNTGASTYSPDGLRADPIYGLGLQPLQGGELPAGATAILMSATIAGVNGGYPIWVLLECMGGAQQVPNAAQSQHAVTLGQMKALGLGMTDVGPFIGDLNDVSFNAGFYYFNSTTTNVPIPSAQGMVLHKVYGSAGFQLLQSYSNDRLLWRKRSGGVWGQWNEAANLDSPSFTGTPTVPTAAQGTNTAQAANTAFVQAEFAAKFGASLAGNGYQRLAGGLIIQWGGVALGAGLTAAAVTFPIAFPSGVLFPPIPVNNGSAYAANATNITQTGMTLQNTSTSSNAGTVSWIAIGK